MNRFPTALRNAFFFASLPLLCSLVSCVSGNIAPLADNVKVRETSVPFYRSLDAVFLDGTSPVIMRDERKKMRHIVERYNDTLALQWRVFIPFDRVFTTTSLLFAKAGEGVVLVQARQYRDDSVAISGRLLDGRTGEERTIRAIRTLEGELYGDEDRLRGLLLSDDSARIALYDLHVAKDETSGKKQLRMRATFIDTDLTNPREALFVMPLDDELKELGDLRFLALSLGKDSRLYAASYDKDSILYIHRCSGKDGSVQTARLSLKGMNDRTGGAALGGCSILERGNNRALLVSSLMDENIFTARELYGYAVIGADFARNRTTSAFRKLEGSDGGYDHYNLRAISGYTDSDTMLLTFARVTGAGRPTSRNMAANSSKDVVYYHSGIFLAAVDSGANLLWSFRPNSSPFSTKDSPIATSTSCFSGDSLVLFYRRNFSDFALYSLSYKNGKQESGQQIISTKRQLLPGTASWPNCRTVYMVLGAGEEATLVRLELQ